MSFLNENAANNSGLGNEKYNSIVQKAIEARNSKERLLNDSQDRSCSILVKRHKKKLGLSQSFVMRQASALSRKNKELVDALRISKHQIQVYEKSMNLLQSTQMALRFKLNSREVELQQITEEFKKIKEERDKCMSLFTTFRDLITDADLSFGDKSIDFGNEVIFSAQPRKGKPASGMQSDKLEKWNPDLTMIQEKSIVRRELEMSQRLSSIESESPKETNASPPPLEANQMVNCEEDISPECNFQYRRKSRRQSAFYIASDFVVQSEKEKQTSTANEREITSPTSGNNVQDSQHGLNISTATTTDTILSQQSMDFTDPCESMIEVGDSIFSNASETGIKTKSGSQLKNTGKPTKPTKQVRSNLQNNPTKKSRKRGKTKKEVTFAENVGLGDSLNCSNDSFLTNPDKKIVLTNQPTSDKDDLSLRNSFGLSDITNSRKGSRPLRRNASICYREPKLNSKLRRGDKISDNSLYQK
uniref:Uncharacterized protein LOC100177943 n=1 Tax=Phallusia mammillata TaxID=59560 RepID=A0A6F9DHH8_9ASCI|nr:uncharacterized protein LOC100177943 [Phallusia mammillata]